VKRNDVPVKLDADVVRDAKIVAAYKAKSLAEYLSELVRPLVARDLEQEHARRMKAARPKGGG
jgi:hypothetical protein